MSKNEVDKLSGFTVVTGASSGIGRELAKLAAKDGCDMLLVADRDLAAAEMEVRDCGAASVEILECDLATESGVQELMDKIGTRQVDNLMANAGTSEGGAFLDHEWGQIVHTIHTNITGTVSLIYRVGRTMRDSNRGRILVTGSIVGDMPGPYNLIYNSTKAFIDDFCVGLATELKDTDVVITCLLPGVTDTEFFRNADMEDDTMVGQTDMKADPAKVAKDGYEALLEGETKEVSGLMNKVQYFFADILPAPLVSKMHERMAKPDGK
ncbi:SDR family NAD(P)-dependent oxidoreductase [Aurantiacibacter poecillastricola]|uniref:SDR family NAD(P)-dependent oxidoreductase n=1 Tax=Aurantiacibacter poecillastricola TaxID=3064385 RepID=UPI00273EBE7F|nr:SDR family NAD(P)-dependent oxidoreductase [Aurantiacibacter sp. 219JJ12-13]MDP5261150.1 SDR family NAD(P)-dependent oxidoreductase [Aurantiacibacter sp. 219JJ12-13]